MGFQAVEKGEEGEDKRTGTTSTLSSSLQRGRRPTCVLQTPVLADGSGGLQVGPVVEQHLHGGGLHLGRSVGYDVKQVLHTQGCYTPCSRQGNICTTLRKSITCILDAIYIC